LATLGLAARRDLTEKARLASKNSDKDDKNNNSYYCHNDNIKAHALSLLVEKHVKKKRF
jgi:hypothetical protein